MKQRTKIKLLLATLILTLSIGFCGIQKGEYCLYNGAWILFSVEDYPEGIPEELKSFCDAIR